jgi:YVTN family beta-propeller protein
VVSATRPFYSRIVATHLQIGGEILGYRLEELAGRGGMGIVYRAYDGRLKRTVALKLVVPELSQDERFRTRFLAETEAAAALEHSNVVPIHDAGEFEGQLYLVMRYVDGSDLKALLRTEGELEPARAVAISTQIAAALDAAHAHGLVHRDVKPSNVLLDAHDHVYLSDFGLARRLGEAMPPVGGEPSLGTPAYASPEQVAGGAVDGRADVYALACVLHECLTGEVPYPRASELAVLWAHLHDPPPSVARYPELEPVMAKALAKDPDERYPTCAELVEAARGALGLRDVVVRDRKPLLMIAAGLVVALAATVAALLLVRSHGPSRPSTKPVPVPKVDSLQRIDPTKNELLATFRLGSDPTGVAVDRQSVWVAEHDQNRITKIDPRTNRVVATGSAPGPLAITAGEGSVWVLTADGLVAQLDARTGANLHQIVVPDEAQAAELAASGGGGVWLAAPVNGVVSHVNPRSSTFVSTIATGALKGALKGIAAGEGSVWVSSSDLLADDYTLLRIDPLDNRVVARTPLRLGADGVSAGEGYVWVANSLGNTVSQVDPRTNRLVRTIRVGRDPVAVAAGGDGVWVANYKDGTVSHVDPKLGRVVATIPVGPNPDHLAADERGVWVTVHVR